MILTAVGSDWQQQVPTAIVWNFSNFAIILRFYRIYHFISYLNGNFEVFRAKNFILTVLRMSTIGLTAIIPSSLRILKFYFDRYRVGRYRFRGLLVMSAVNLTDRNRCFESGQRLKSSLYISQLTAYYLLYI